jgi:tetratricopeptide (TPR) repeat protein
MNRKITIKYWAPLIIVFSMAVLFLVLYNHYLLNASLANLKLALKETSQQKKIEGVRKIADILNDTYIAELTKGDFDLALAIKLEMSAQMFEDISKAVRKENEQYLLALSSAANIHFAATIIQKATQITQFQDVRKFIQTAISLKEEAEKRPAWMSTVDDLILNFSPEQRQPDVNKIKSNAVKLQGKLASYRGEKLQEKYLEIAKLYLLIKDWQNAQLYLNKSCETDSKNFVALKAKFFLAILYKLKGDFKEASTVFSSIKNSLPKDWKLFSTYEEADCIYKMGAINKSAELFEEIFNTGKSSDIAQLAQFRAGYIYLYDLKEPLRAKEVFNKLPQESTLFGIGPYAREKINRDIARWYCEEGFRLIKEGYVLSAPAKYREALAKFDMAENVEHNYGIIYIGKALALTFLGKPEMALKEARKAKDVAPDDPDVLANLGFIYYKFNMIDQAIAEFEAAVAIRKDSGLFHYNLGTLYTLKQLYDEAERQFRAALLLDSGYTYAYNNLAYTLLIKRSYSEAKERLRKAIVLNPDCIDAHYNLGAVYYALGNYEDSKKEFKYIEKTRPDFRKTQEYLTQIAEKLGYK